MYEDERGVKAALTEEKHFLVFVSKKDKQNKQMVYNNKLLERTDL